MLVAFVGQDPADTAKVMAVCKQFGADVPVLIARDQADEDVIAAAMQQGARDAHSGFVGINVFRQAEAAPLTELLGVLQDPAVLVFKRPGTVFVQLNGFADKDTVAQAAANAALAQ